MALFTKRQLPIRKSSLITEKLRGVPRSTSLRKFVGKQRPRTLLVENRKQFLRDVQGLTRYTDFHVAYY